MQELLIDGPGKNALSSELMTSLRERIEAAGDAPLLLRGANGAFSAGLDLKEVVSLDPTGMDAFLRRLEALMATLFHYPGPTVACLDGHAIAGGCILALCCDRIVCAPQPKLRIGLNEGALGLRFPPTVFSIVRHRVAPRYLDEVVLGAGLYSPEDALRVGLVDELAADPLATSQAWLERLASHPPAAYAAIKRDLKPDARPNEATLSAYLEEALPMWTGDALKNRLRAVLGR
jgi:enoyl-CoA hydratase/carnithine racemase